MIQTDPTLPINLTNELIDFERTRPRINSTTGLKHQNAYTIALNGEFARLAFDEMRAPLNKGLWRSKVFENSSESEPMDLEIGTGAGTHFAHYATMNPTRLLVGMELKYKPLIQSIRRSLNNGCKNTAIMRYHAFNVDEVFSNNELNNVMIHFPDPWVSPRKPKNRIVSAHFLNRLHRLQRPNSIVEFKTDSLESFQWSLEEVKNTAYKLEACTFDLHASEWASSNFTTTFEKIFLRQGIKINYLRLRHYQ